MSWAVVFSLWWLPMAEHLHYTQADILALTLDDFLRAVEYVKGRVNNAG